MMGPIFAALLRCLFDILVAFVGRKTVDPTRLNTCRCGRAIGAAENHCPSCSEGYEQDTKMAKWRGKEISTMATSHIFNSMKLLEKNAFEEAFKNPLNAYSPAELFLLSNEKKIQGIKIHLDPLYYELEKEFMKRDIVWTDLLTCTSMVGPVEIKVGRFGAPPINDESFQAPWAKK